jgi:L-threonylcarbamoyladenylate synthase
MPRARVLKLEAENPDPKAVEFAAGLLRAGAVIVIPTDTVYGLACDPGNERAIGRIYEIKGRPRDLPLILLIACREDLRRFCAAVPESAERAARAFWPGPLTIVLPRAQVVSLALAAAGETIGLRLPDHAVPRELIRLAGFPLASTSANRSRLPAARTAEEALAAVGEGVDLVLDAGPAPLGVESTVADFSVSPPRVLREGAVPARDLGRS